MNRVSCVLLVAILLLPAVATAAISPDTDFDQRAEAVLAEIATRYEGKTSFDGASCFGFGASTMALVSRIELAERGLSGGMSLADAEDDVVHYADEAIRLAGDANDVCVWGNAGSPGTFHGFLGLAMILHRYKDRLANATVQKLQTAADGYWMDDVAPYLVNAHMGIIAGRLLAGETMGYDSALWQQGVAEFEEVYEMTTYHGGLEMNAPIYTAYQFASLMPLMELEHDEIRGKARIMLDYLFLVHAHLYLPGGGMGAPQSRDYAGGARDTSTSLARIAGLWANDSAFEPTRNVHLIGAVTDYRLPEVIRSIYLDKGDGYTFHAYTPAPVRSRHGRGYDFGKDGYPVAPWEAVVTPDAMFGVNHGFRYQSIHVSMGVYASAPDGSFPVLYQYQPWVAGDTSETGGGLPSTSGDDEPDDFVREGYDYRRLVHERAMVSIWDPTLAHKTSGSVRTHQDTRVHIPDYSAYGGQMRSPTDTNTGGWFVGQIGQTYIAYYPLGTASVGPERRSQIQGAQGRGTRDTEHYYLRLDGRSGGIVELATTDDFATLDAYVDDLKGRHVDFSTGAPYYAEFDAYVPSTGGYERMRIEYKPEKRSIDGQWLTDAEALDHGWLDSAFLDYDPTARTLTVARDCYPQMHYDLTSGAVTQQPPSGPGCYAPVEETVFSPVAYFGDFANYTPADRTRWSVVEDSTGERRLFLAPYEYVADGDRLGEHAVVDGRTFEDFTLTLRARTNESIAETQNADYAVIFGYQDPSNYYFLLANARAEYSELFVLEDGVRTQIGLADAALIPDEDWHDLEITRTGADITVSLDGQTMLTASDATFGEGSVGLGTLNDSALFDDFEVVDPAQPGGDTMDAGTGDTGSDDVGSDDASSSGDAGGDDASGETTVVSGRGEGCACTSTNGDSPTRAWWLALAALVIVGRLRASKW